jgi:hypothetical protein
MATNFALHCAKRYISLLTFVFLRYIIKLYQSRRDELREETPKEFGEFTMYRIYLKNKNNKKYPAEVVIIAAVVFGAVGLLFWLTS